MYIERRKVQMHQYFILQICSKFSTAYFISDERLRFSPPRILCFHKHAVNLLQGMKILTPSSPFRFLPIHLDHDAELCPHSSGSFSLLRRSNSSTSLPLYLRYLQIPNFMPMVWPSRASNLISVPLPSIHLSNDPVIPSTLR